MATIDIRKPHELGMETAKERAEELAGELSDQLGLDWKWEGDNIAFRGNKGTAKGVKGMVSVAASQIHIGIDLPLMLRPMKGAIAARVERRLDKLVE